MLLKDFSANKKKMYFVNGFQFFKILKFINKAFNFKTARYDMHLGKPENTTAKKKTVTELNNLGIR